MMRTVTIFTALLVTSLTLYGGFLPDLFGKEQNLTADRVLIVKSKRKLYLLKKNKIIAEYHIALGSEPVGKKSREGDRRTPEGNYTLDFRKKNSDFYRAIHISYPNRADRLRAKKEGVKPGGAIMIHGQPNGWGWLSVILQRFDWTAGCIALSNGDMDEIWQRVKNKTPIEIRK